MANDELTVLINSNVIISGLLFPREGSPPKFILDTFIKSRLGLLPFLLNIVIPEYERDEIVNKIEEKFGDRFTPSVQITLALIFDNCEIIPNEDIKKEIKRSNELIGSRDEDDVPIVACALCRKPHYLVTGDNDILDLDNINGTKAVKPAEFKQILLTKYFKS
jgi:putative PIN family toxin of toxin-antitoxin system